MAGAAKDFANRFATGVRKVNKVSEAVSPLNSGPGSSRQVTPTVAKAMSIAAEASKDVPKVSPRDIRALDPALCLPSMVSDRSMEDLDQGVEELAESVKVNGQQVPILVRPHPTEDGRFQIAFGHRRVRACLKLNRAVLGIVKDLSDEQLVISQGQENQQRKDLTYIQRCRFAAELIKTYPRTVVVSAIGGGDKTIVSKLVNITRKIPEDIIIAIGPARGIGRVKWENLAKHCEDLTLTRVRSSISQRQNSGSWDQLESPERFAVVFELVAKATEQRHFAADNSMVEGLDQQNSQNKAANGTNQIGMAQSRKRIEISSRFTLDARLEKDNPTIKVKGPEARQFSAWLLGRLSELTLEYQRQHDSKEKSE